MGHVRTRLVSKGRIPYGGMWTPKDPLTGDVIRAVTFEQLVAKAAAARRANGLHIGSEFEDEVEQWCCEAHPDECQDVDPERPRRKRLTLDDVVRGAKVLLSFKLGGSRLVDRAEAERRAKICARCSLNTGYQRPCAACHELTNIVRSITGGETTSVDDRLHVCHVCGCELKSAVWLELSDQCKGVTPSMAREFSYMHDAIGCWKQCT
jgi:hypothetical protein